MKILLILVSMLMVQNASTIRTVSGRITVDDGSPVPTVDTFRGPNVMVGLLATLPGTSSRLAEATTQSDGSFVIPLGSAGGTGEFAIHAARVPLGYYVKSIRYGTADLLRSNLALTPGSSSSTEIQLVLTKTPPTGARAFKVDGRVTNWTANTSSSVTVSLQSTQPGPDGVFVLYIGITRVKADGTFEVRGVPPGRYRAFTPPDSRDLIGFDVTDRDVSGLEVALAPGASSMIITGGPVSTLRTTIRPSPEQVAGPAAPLLPPTGSAMVSVSQSGRYGYKMYEGAVSLFRIEQLGIPIEEKKLEGSPLSFTISPGSYELRGYLRGCDGNCGNLGEPESVCTVPFRVAAGEVLYAERILQNGTCTIRFNPAPQR